MNTPETIKPINAAHEALLSTDDALCVDAVAAATGMKKRYAAKQIKQLAGLGLIEPEFRAGGVPFYRLIAAPVAGDSEGGEADAPAADADGWIPWVATADSVCPVPDGTRVRVKLNNGIETAENSDDLAENIIWHELPTASVVAYKIIAQAPADFATTPELQYLAPKDYEMPPADPDFLAAANRALGEQLESITSERDDLRARLDVMEKMIDDLRAEFKAERIARHALEERADVAKYAPSGYLVCATKRKPRRINDGERAKLAALAAVRAGAARAEVLAVVPVGTARRGAEWREA